MKINLFCFASGLLLGFFLSCVLFQSSKQKEKPLVQMSNPKQLQKEVVTAEEQSGKVLDSLKVRSIKLNAELKETRTALEKAKGKNFSLQLQVFELLDRRFEQQQRSNIHSSVLDDSVATIIPELLSSAAVKDSLYERTTTNLEEQVRSRDSVIVVKNKQYGDLKKAFGASITGQTVLEKQNKMLTKVGNRQKVKSKVLSAALLIVSGAAAISILHR